MHWTAVILGPPNSPYARGLFHFDLRFPRDYPNEPPQVLITTTSSSMVRFNPNLYASGKVCLSILGTWTAESSGEKWSAVQNVCSVLQSIQSLMHDKPLHNEPGFEADNGLDMDRYNEKVAHESIRVAVLEVMEDTISARPHRNGAVAAFADLRKQLFTMQFEQYLTSIDHWSQVNEMVVDGRQFKVMPFEMGRNAMCGSFAWRQLRERTEQLREQVDAEIKEWVETGKEQAALLQGQSVVGLVPAITALREQLQQLQEEPVDHCSVGAAESNALVWEVTLLGPDGTGWEGGFFQFNIIFPPTYPDLSPRIRFSSRMYHPNISPAGYPYVASLLLWHGLASKQRAARSLLEEVRRLVVNSPDPEPVTHLNSEAAALCFAATEEKRKEYSRKVRRCAEMSTEE